jgi:ribose 5-phosphate isomerase A
VPFGARRCAVRLGELGLRPTVRTRDGNPQPTDNGNWILDCGVDPIPDPGRLEFAIRAVPGVVGTGLFLGMANTVMVENEGRVEIRTRPGGA